MPRHCICYTTDAGYLFPTFVSAMQARHNTPADMADILICSIGTPARLDNAFAYASASEGLGFLTVPTDMVDGEAAMLARLFLDRIVPADYDQLLYIDGDTQITGMLSPLLLAEVQPDHFLAASDPMIFALPAGRQHGQKFSDYFESIGMEQRNFNNYFNSGVLRINRHGWDKIGQNAMALFRRLRDRSHYPDQDALNLTAMDQRISMSLAWNFPVFLRNAGLEQEITPRIIHYMGSPKPWHGQFEPWKSSEYQAYLDAAQKYPTLIPFLPHTTWSRRLKYLLQQRYKQIWERADWGNNRRRDEILHYERGIQSTLAS